MSKKTSTKTTKPTKPAKTHGKTSKSARAEGPAKTVRLRKQALAVADANLARLEADAGGTAPDVPAGEAPSPNDATNGTDATRANVGRKRGKAEPKPKADPKPKKASGLDLAAKVLADADEPLSAKTIAERAIAAGWATAGKTPQATLYAAIIREIAAKGEAARFRKTDRGLFAAGKGA